MAFRVRSGRFRVPPVKARCPCPAVAENPRIGPDTGRGPSIWLSLPGFLSKEKEPPACGPVAKETLVPLAAGTHLFPFRTEQLSPPAPMVLGKHARESRSVPTQHTVLAPVAKAAGAFLFHTNHNKTSVPRATR